MDVVDVLTSAEVSMAELEAAAYGLGADQAAEFVERLTTMEINKAIDVLQRFYDVKAPRLVEVLGALLKYGNPLLGDMAAGFLKGEGEQAVPMLTKALVDAHPIVEMRIYIALEHIGDPGATPALIERLAVTNSPTLRYTIIRALGTLGAPEAAAAIEPHRNDPDRHVRKYAEAALKRLYT